ARRPAVDAAVGIVGQAHPMAVVARPPHDGSELPAYQARARINEIPAAYAAHRFTVQPRMYLPRTGDDGSIDGDCFPGVHHDLLTGPQLSGGDSFALFTIYSQYRVIEGIGDFHPRVLEGCRKVLIRNQYDAKHRQLSPSKAERG